MTKDELWKLYQLEYAKADLIARQLDEQNRKARKIWLKWKRADR